MTLDVAIATWQPSGLGRIVEMKLPAVPGVRYVVSWQEHGNNPVIPPEIACREDITVCLCEEKGVSRNRNNALDRCSAEIVLMGDDDLSYRAEELKGVIKAFEQRPEMQVATFRYHGAMKQYPKSETPLRFPLPKNYGVATFEIAVRRKECRGLRFDELYGPGSPVWQAAEDEKFLWDARKAGLDCRFIPLDVATHTGPTTGDRVLSKPGIAAASGKVIRLEFPRTWILRTLLKSLRQWRRGGNFFFCLYHQFRGALSDGKAAAPKA